MKATFRVREDLSVEVEGESQKDLFRELASAAEVYGERQCGLCQTTDIAPLCRTAEKFEFFEWHCLGCGARLSMGQLKEGGRLFPKRRLDSNGKPDMEHGQPGEHRGWSHYRGEGNEEPTQPPRQQPAKPQQAAPAKATAQANGPVPGVSEQQWEQLKSELAVAAVSQRAFLDYFHAKGPRDLPAARFHEALSLAQHPNAELRRLQTTMKQGTL